MLRSPIAALLVLIATPAAASTLGLLPCTSTVKEFTIAKPKAAARLVVARTVAEWHAAWKAAGGSAHTEGVDFDRQMIVGIVNAANDDRVIYRIQIDSAAAPSALEIHVSTAGAPCGFQARTRTSIGAHFVVTPRSALPVHFLLDSMIDGMIYVSDPTTEGVGTKDLGTVAALVNTTAATDKAATREDAEHTVFDALTSAQKAMLAKGPLDRTLWRFPHGWTKLDVVRDKNTWSIKYESLMFTVDVATGKVVRQ